MKKLLALLLALVMLLSLAACGDREDDDDDDDRKKDEQTEQTEDRDLSDLFGTTQMTEPETTAPAEPTEEELVLLENYCALVRVIESVDPEIVDEQTDSWLYGSAAIGYCCDQIKQMDTSVLDKWAGTEYADPSVNWDYQAVLDSVQVLEDVKLRQVHTYTDNVGNVSTDEYGASWEYDEAGMILFVANEQNAFEQIVTNPKELYGERYYTYGADGKVTEVRFGGSNGDGTIYTDYLVTLSYDAAGNVTVANVKNNYDSYDVKYAYDSQNRLTQVEYEMFPGTNDHIVTYTYTYDASGNVVKEEKTTHYYEEAYAADVILEKEIMEYTYDTNGHLASGVYTYEYWDKTVNHSMNGLEVTYILEEQYVLRDKQDQYVFTCDEEGRVLTMTVTMGDEIFRSGYSQGQVYSDSDYATEEVEVIYGDYYIYNPAN